MGSENHYIAGIHQGTAFYRDNSDWSLLRFIDRHRSSLAATGLPDADIVLNFVTPLASAGGTQVDADTVSNAFISLGMYSTNPEDGGRVSIKWPAQFPASAPELIDKSVASN